MADHPDAAQRGIDGLRVADVAVHELEAGIAGEGGSAVGVYARQQRVKHPYLVARVDERLDNVGSNKAGTAGHQDSHALRLGTVTFGISAEAREFISL